MNEFGETPTIYVWPMGHEGGSPYPKDFYEKMGKALAAAGIEWELA